MRAPTISNTCRKVCLWMRCLLQNKCQHSAVPVSSTVPTQCQHSAVPTLSSANTQQCLWAAQCQHSAVPTLSSACEQHSADTQQCQHSAVPVTERVLGNTCSEVCPETQPCLSEAHAQSEQCLWDTECHHSAFKPGWVPVGHWVPSLSIQTRVSACGTLSTITQHSNPGECLWDWVPSLSTRSLASAWPGGVCCVEHRQPLPGGQYWRDLMRLEALGFWSALEHTQPLLGGHRQRCALTSADISRGGGTSMLGLHRVAMQWRHLTYTFAPVVKRWAPRVPRVDGSINLDAWGHRTHMQRAGTTLYKCVTRLRKVPVAYTWYNVRQAP